MNEYFIITKDDEEVICKTLLSATINDINYIIYTDFSQDIDGNFTILASRYNIINNELNLIPIEDNEEWDKLDKIWKEHVNEQDKNFSKVRKEQE